MPPGPIPLSLSSIHMAATANAMSFKYFALPAYRVPSLFQMFAQDKPVLTVYTYDSFAAGVAWPRAQRHFRRPAVAR